MVAGVEALKERIRQRAEKEAQAIIAEAEKQAAAIIGEAEAEAKQRETEILEAAQREADERGRRTLAMAAMQARRQELKTKEEAIDEAFSLAIKTLQDLPADKYRQLLIPMIVAAVETGTEELVLSDRDKKRLTGNFINDINKELKAQGKVGELTLSKETRQLEGGFILSAEGVENNHSFELILKLSRDDLEQEVAGVLFPAS